MAGTDKPPLSPPGYSFSDLARYMLKLGTVGFGGPVALVGYMRRDPVGHAMKRSKFASCTAASIAGLLSASGMAMAAERHRSHENAPLGQLFASHEYGDGIHYAFQFHPDGTLTGTEMGKAVRGTWRATKSELCWTWTRPLVDEECYTMRRKGQDIMLDRDGVEQWVGSLRPVGAEKQR